MYRYALSTVYRMTDRNGVKTTYTSNLYGSPIGRRAKVLEKSDKL